MPIISIDVGIKNLAYCVLESLDNDIYKIIQWDVINLCGEEHLCNCPLKSNALKNNAKKNKAKKVIESIENNIICNKKATYVKAIEGVNNYFCQIHAKQSTYLLPNASLKKIKSWKRDALVSYALEKGIVFEENSKKDSLIKKINDFLREKMLDKISTVSANEMTLIQMGIKIVQEFDKRLDFSNISHIAIENQISPIANRMKTLQGMLAQYFIMRDKPSISFISSANKLKKNNVEKNDVLKTQTTYTERKKEGVKIVKELLEKYNTEWLDKFLHHKKKDDLADAFLQGIWVYNNKKF